MVARTSPTVTVGDDLGVGLPGSASPCRRYASGVQSRALQKPVPASYAGDGGHAASNAQTTLGVLDRITSTTLRCDLSTLAVAQPTTCTATVSDISPGKASPAERNGYVIGNRNDSFNPSPCTVSGSGSSLSCQTTYTPTAGKPGASHQITARYTAALDRPR
jgi:hypothetical protein